MTVVVAGGSGFLGRYLIPELADRGHPVLVLWQRLWKGILQSERRMRSLVLNR